MTKRRERPSSESIWDWFRGPDKTAAIFWISGGIAILTILPMEPWPERTFDFMVVAAILSFTAAILRLIYADRLPRWTFHLGLSLATIGIGGLVMATHKYSMNLSVLFIWVALFAALNFTPKAAFSQMAFAGVTYAIVLRSVTPSSAPLEEWLQIMGTSVVAGGAIMLLIRELTSLSRQDSLTKLPNRRAWKLTLDEEFARAQRTSSPFSVAMIDLDGLKEINDQSGHMAGDQILQTLGKHWLPLTRKGTMIARIGGDEFAIIAPDTDAHDLEVLCKRLAESTPNITFSVGVATWDGQETSNELLRRADKKMYLNKARKYELPS